MTTHAEASSGIDTGDPGRVLLAGCGDLGTQVGLRLQAQGHTVTGVRRTPQKRRLPFEVIGMDLASPGDTLLPEADAVVVALTPDSRDADGYQRAYRRTLRGLAEALPRPPKQLIFISSTSVLGDGHQHPVTEDTTPAPQRDTAEVLLAAEQDAAELFEHTAVIRPAGIYGPGRTRLIDQVRRGQAADHGRLTNRIHRDDLVSTILTVLQHRKPPPLLHAVDEEPAPLGQVLRFIAGELAVPVPPDSGSGELHGKRIVGTRLQRLITEPGLRFPTFREGYSALLQSEDPQT